MFNRITTPAVSACDAVSDQHMLLCKVAVLSNNLHPQHKLSAAQSMWACVWYRQPEMDESSRQRSEGVAHDSQASMHGSAPVASAGHNPTVLI